MFNGIIKNQGKIEKIIKQSRNFILFLQSNIKFNKKKLAIQSVVMAYALPFTR